MHIKKNHTHKKLHSHKNSHIMLMRTCVHWRCSEATATFKHSTCSHPSARPLTHRHTESHIRLPKEIKLFSRNKRKELPFSNGTKKVHDNVGELIALVGLCERNCSFVDHALWARSRWLTRSKARLGHAKIEWVEILWFVSYSTLQNLTFDLAYLGDLASWMFIGNGPLQTQV